jgi:hypothetical protein
MTAAPKRRWLRYSLRTLFVVVTVFGVWLGWQASIVHERKRILSSLERQASDSFNPYVALFKMKQATLKLGPADWPWPTNPIPWVRRMLGDKPVVFLGVPETMTKHDILHIKKCFPEAAISGRSSLDEQGVVEWTPDR